MPKYLVNSYSRDDGGQFLGDFVEAENADAAVDIVRRARPYAIIDEDMVETTADLRAKADRLDACRDVPATAWDLADSIGESGHLCRECGEDNEDGEGYDGLCGNCADKAEKAGVYDK